jgi:glycosyltransferase involved in cell wall biosynthesis
MNVWVIGHAYVTRVAHDKLRALAALPDVDLTVIAPGAWRTTTAVLTLAPEAVPYRVIPSRVFLNGRIGAYVYRDGLGALRRARPDIVHAEVEPSSLAALQCLLAARGSPFVIFTWENLEGPPRVLSRSIERLVVRRAAFVIAGNQAARARMLRRGVPSDRLAVLPQFGVDPGRYAAGDRGRVRIPPGPPVVGFVGRLVPEKGVDLLADAMEQLEVRLAVVGDGPGRIDLERRLAAWPDGKAILAGSVRDTDVPDYLACLDVLVLPSRTTAAWAEQFGRVLIEAMAAGVPVVGSSSGAIPEVIGDAGLIFPEGDAGALRRQVEWILLDPMTRSTLTARGRQRVRARYAEAVVAAGQRDVYARVLGRLPTPAT